MIRILDALEDFEDQIAADNQEVTDKIKNAQPFLIDVVPAKTVIAELNEQQKRYYMLDLQSSGQK